MPKLGLVQSVTLLAGTMIAFAIGIVIAIMLTIAGIVMVATAL